VSTVNALVPRYTALQAVDRSDEFARELFGAFRDVFRADRLREAAVFWVEQKVGGLIIRHVRDLNRVRKSDDQLVGRTINDLAAVRIMIGNFVAGCKLTTTRWEIYGDFELTQRLEMGRFDIRDLFGDIDAEKVEMLTQQGICPSGDWDFDGIVLMHRCPLCGKLFDKKSVLYVSRKKCESCGQVPTRDDTLRIVKHLMLGFRAKQERLAVHQVGTQEEFHVQYFTDPLPNSVTYWAVENGPGTAGGEDLFDQQFREWFRQCYNHSLFKALTCDALRQHLLENLTADEDDDKWAIPISCIRRIGEKLGMMGSTLDLTLEELDHKVVTVGLPEFINFLIRRHGTATTQEEGGHHDQPASRRS
jgi:hypothetical protein